MNQTTYALWLKSAKSEFIEGPGLVNVITAAFNGISHSNRRFSFTDYPSQYASDLRHLTSLVAASGFSIGEDSFISAVEFGFVRTYVVNISLPEYGDESFVRFVIYGDVPVAQQFDFSGSKFINLSVTVNSPSSVYLTGSNPILRNWDSHNAVPLFPGSQDANVWNLNIPLLPGELIEFKLVDANGRYEPGPNRTYKAGDMNDQLLIDWIH
jgi:hypothetical protein